MPAGKCKNWNGYIWPSGYGCIKRGGRSQRAHRYFYEQKHGEIKHGNVIDHLCRNKKCINVDHLEEVSVAENTRRGLSAKINRKQVEQILHLSKLGRTQKEIANIFRLNQSSISRIINHKRWYA